MLFYYNGSFSIKFGKINGRKGWIIKATWKYKIYEMATFGQHLFGMVLCPESTQGQELIILPLTVVREIVSRSI